MSAAAGAPVSAPGRLAGATRPVAATGAGRRTARTPYSRERQPLGDPSPLACTIAKAALEAVHGADTLSSLVRWVEPDLRARLARQHSVARRAGRHGATARVLRARVCRVAADAAEVSVVASVDGRSHAIAMRLEDQHGRWVATVIDIG
ncbi:Rv3235 family protein [Demequina sp. NBRC 110052]|uniref:Rv3235 family protein n=1 Tax=Demequina sp. NBRC 110052 TaxID=1570341 RepID=UPI0009FF2860|nr:Rv3235 family protein [Demequina sp. NBRC 110052]